MTAAEDTRDIAEAKESDSTLGDEVEIVTPDIKPDLARLESKWDTHLSAIGNRFQENVDVLLETTSRAQDGRMQSLEAFNQDIDTMFGAK